VAIVDHDALRGVVAEPAALTVELGERHRIPDVLSQPSERLKQIPVAVTVDRRARRVKGRRVDAGQRLGLDVGEHERAAKEHARVRAILAVVIKVLDLDRREDHEPLLAFADRAAELQPRAKTSDATRLDATGVALMRQQDRVAQRIRVKHRPRAHPALPTLRGQQLPRRRMQALQIGAPTLSTLLL